jgi:hypothetical protein
MLKERIVCETTKIIIGRYTFKGNKYKHALLTGGTIFSVTNL